MLVFDRGIVAEPPLSYYDFDCSDWRSAVVHGDRDLEALATRDAALMLMLLLTLTLPEGRCPAVTPKGSVYSYGIYFGLTAILFV